MCFVCLLSIKFQQNFENVSLSVAQPHVAQERTKAVNSLLFNIMEKKATHNECDFQQTELDRGIHEGFIFTRQRL